MAEAIDYTKQIQTLVSENEFLQLQLEDLNNTVKNKDEEIGILGDAMETAAFLQSRIEGNLAEIEQLKFNLSESGQKNLGSEILNEELENELLKEIREKQKKEAELKGLSSVQTEIEIMTGEMNEASGLYAKLRQLKADLAEKTSETELLKIENEELKAGIDELNLLVTELKKKKLD